MIKSTVTRGGGPWHVRALPLSFFRYTAPSIGLAFVLGRSDCRIYFGDGNSPSRGGVKSSDDIRGQKEDEVGGK